jgi:hypothetical protein
MHDAVSSDTQLPWRVQFCQLSSLHVHDPGLRQINFRLAPFDSGRASLRNGWSFALPVSNNEAPRLCPFHLREREIRLK